MKVPTLPTRTFLVAHSYARLVSRETGSRRISLGFFDRNPGHQTHVDEGADKAWLSLFDEAGVEDRCDVPVQHAKVVLDLCTARMSMDRAEMASDKWIMLLDRLVDRGACLATVVFDSRSAADEFGPPAWLGREVSGDDDWSMRRLCLSGLPVSDACEPTDRGLDALLDALDSGRSKRTSLPARMGVSDPPELSQILKVLERRPPDERRSEAAAG